MHLDFGPDVSSGAVIPLLECFTDMEIGMSIAQGRASRMVEALAGLLDEAGGEIRTHAEVRRVITTAGRVAGAQLDSGERIAAKRAVIANLTPTGLFSHLLAEYPFSARFRRQVQQYRYGPGTMMIHLALSGRPRWTAGDELGEFAYIHVAPYVDDLARTYTQALNGYLPASLMLVVGQTSVVDPSRAPSGRQVL
jgi:phytoene dehydrogenase-like protein